MTLLSLTWKYAQENSLPLSASLCFEQSYKGIDGDSAFSIEFYALLSSLSGVPIKQKIGVTGSAVAGDGGKAKAFLCPGCRGEEAVGIDGSIYGKFCVLINLAPRVGFEPTT